MRFQSRLWKVIQTKNAAIILDIFWGLHRGPSVNK
jgi:hypothetical protein